MRGQGWWVAGAVVSACSSAAAAPVTDVTAWVRQFEAVALTTDVDAMVTQLHDVADPRFDTAGLRALLSRVGPVVGPGPGETVEHFREVTVGTFLKRIDVAVIYAKTQMYYSLTFMHHQRGWELIQFDYNTDVNAILELKWPT